MKMPLNEILDRISILDLKRSRIEGADVEAEWMAMTKEVESAIQYGVGFETILLAVLKLHDINRQIWDLEADIRRGKEGELGLEEVGKRALAIRDLNRQRVSVKSGIVDATGMGYKDVKGNHAST